MRIIIFCLKSAIIPDRFKFLFFSSQIIFYALQIFLNRYLFKACALLLRFFMHWDSWGEAVSSVFDLDLTRIKLICLDFAIRRFSPELIRNFSTLFAEHCHESRNFRNDINSTLTISSISEIFHRIRSPLGVSYLFLTHLISLLTPILHRTILVRCYCF